MNYRLIIFYNHKIIGKGIGMNWVLSGCGRWFIIRDECREICFLMDIYRGILFIYLVYLSNF